MAAKSPEEIRDQVKNHLQPCACAGCSSLAWYDYSQELEAELAQLRAKAAILDLIETHCMEVLRMCNGEVLVRAWVGGESRPHDTDQQQADTLTEAVQALAARIKPPAGVQ